MSLKLIKLTKEYEEQLGEMIDEWKKETDFLAQLTFVIILMIFFSMSMNMMQEILEQIPMRKHFYLDLMY